MGPTAVLDPLVHWNLEGQARHRRRHGDGLGQEGGGVQGIFLNVFVSTPPALYAGAAVLKGCSVSYASYHVQSDQIWLARSAIEICVLCFCLCALMRRSKRGSRGTCEWITTRQFDIHLSIITKTNFLFSHWARYVGFHLHFGCVL